MKIRGKLNAIIGIIILGFVGSLLLLVYTAVQANQLKDMELATTQTVRDMYRLTDLTKSLLITKDELKTAQTTWAAALKDFTKSLENFANHPARKYLPVEIQDDIKKSQDVWKLTGENFNEIGQITDDLIATQVEGIPQKTGILRMQYQATEKRITGMFVFNLIRVDQKLQLVDIAGRDFIVTILGKLVQDIDTQAEVTMATNRIYSLVLAGIVIIAAVTLLFLFTRSFASRAEKLEAVVRKIAERDLSVRYEDKGRDELGSLCTHLNISISTLSDFLSSVHGAAHKVEELKDSLSAGTTQSASALNEITKNIESIRDQYIILNRNITASTQAVSTITQKFLDLHKNIDGQSKAIGQSSSAIEEMSASIVSVAKLSTDRKNRADDLLRIIREGGEKVGATNDIIKSISKEVDDILEIIEIIDNVSEQTNLLSMNAAIESAHAGEAGKGFAVVAEEIRKLAESTSENASRIDASLKSVTEKIREALSTSNDSHKTFEQINTDVQTFASALSEISSSMDELSEGSKDILGATEKISAITKNIIENSAEMEERTLEIENAMKNSEEISSGVVNGISEIDKGAKEILESLVEISRLTAESRDRMEELHTTVELFKTKEDSETEARTEQPEEEDGVETAEAVEDEEELPQA